MAASFGRGSDYAHASNIVFSENDKDPWHVGTASVPHRGGVNGSVVRWVAHGGAHHQELRFSSTFDAPGVTRARAAQRSAMSSWLGAARAARADAAKASGQTQAQARDS